MSVDTCQGALSDELGRTARTRDAENAQKGKRATSSELEDQKEQAMNLANSPDLRTQKPIVPD